MGHSRPAKNSWNYFNILTGSNSILTLLLIWPVLLGPKCLHQADVLPHCFPMTHIFANDKETILQGDSGFTIFLTPPLILDRMVQS